MVRVWECLCVVLLVYGCGGLVAAKPTLGDQIGDAIETYQYAKGKYDKIKGIIDDAKFLYDSYKVCRAGGAGGYQQGTCSLKAALCLGLKKFLGTGYPIPWNQLLPPLDKTWCLGEPSLKCCKTTSGCHSAFNTDAPINCEGNPYYGPTSTAGLCLAPCPSGCPGCLCDYLAECHIPPSNQKRFDTNTSIPLSTDPWFVYGRRGGYIEAFGKKAAEILSSEYKPSMSPKDQDIDFILNYTDLLEFRGCQDYLRILGTIELPEWEVALSPKVNKTTDPFAHAYSYTRTMEYHLLSRILSGIPNFWNRFDLTQSYVFSSKDRLAYLNGIDSDKNLAEYLSPVAAYLLKNVLPDQWDLLAVPLPGESPVPSDIYDGCTAGAGSEMFLNFTDLKGEARLDLFVRSLDSNISPELAWHTVRVDWGDNVLDKYSLLTPQGYRMVHAYPAPGTYLITVEARNSAGLHTIAHKTVKVQLGFNATNLPRPAPVIRLILNVTAQGNNRGGGAGTFVTSYHAASLENPSQFWALGTTSMESLGNGSAPWVDTFVSFDVHFPWAHATTLKRLQVTCRAFENYIYTSGSLRIPKEATFQVFASQGIPPRFVRTHVVRADGATGIDAEGRYILPCARRGDLFEDDPTTLTLEFEDVLTEPDTPKDSLPLLSEQNIEKRPTQYVTQPLV